MVEKNGWSVLLVTIFSTCGEELSLEGGFFWWVEEPVPQAGGRAVEPGLGELPNACS